MSAVLKRTILILRMFDVPKAREFSIDYFGDGKWGTRELCVDDPSGNQVIFSEPKTA